MLSVRMRPLGLLTLAAILVGAGVTPGCRRQSTPQPVSAGPGPTAASTYGPSARQPASQIPRVQPNRGLDGPWRQSPFFVLESELSPATLVHSTGRHLNLFSDLKSRGLEGPRCVAWSTKDGPRTFTRGTTMDVSRMEENWALVWFAGAAGWTNWDSPWAVFLQHKPTSMRLDDAGLHLSFAETAGDVALMPLYGFFKPPPPGRDFLLDHGLPGKKIRTWEWTNGLPRDPLTRLRYWAGATREIPIYCEDSFSVDRSKDSVTIRSRFQYYPIRDDWNTKPIRLAPLSPTLGLVVKLGGFPVELSKKHFDFELATPFGPYVAIPDADSFDATFKVLQYVNETERLEPPGTNAPAVAFTALAKLRETLRSRFGGGGEDQAGRGPVAWPDRTDATFAAVCAQALPLLDAATRSNAATYLRAAIRDALHQSNIVAAASAKEEAGLGANAPVRLFDTLWICAHVTGDWGPVEDRWTELKARFSFGSKSRWAAFGPDHTAVLADQATPPLAFARIAYKLGDIDAYNYGCYLFAQQLAHLYVKQRGADYFRKEQPWHSMEFMDDEVFVTRLAADTGGWQIDGPKYPVASPQRLYADRWLRFNSVDVGRFYQDWLQNDVRRELNWLQSRGEPVRWTHHDPAGAPSLVQLRSLLLRETQANPAATAGPEEFTGPPTRLVAQCIAICRAAQPARYERLIPGGDPGPFVAGLERENGGPNPGLVANVRAERADQNGQSGQPVWPEPAWPGWAAPAGGPWTFGSIKPVRVNDPSRKIVVPLNWNTRVTTFDLP